MPAAPTTHCGRWTDVERANAGPTGVFTRTSHGAMVLRIVTECHNPPMWSLRSMWTDGLQQRDGAAPCAVCGAVRVCGALPRCGEARRTTPSTLAVEEVSVRADGRALPWHPTPDRSGPPCLTVGGEAADVGGLPSRSSPRGHAEEGGQG
ncbi:hypothetical protein GCM10022227_27300 [Streptomyces sedi]